MYRTRRFYVYSFPTNHPNLPDSLQTSTFLDGAEQEAYWEAVDDIHTCEWFPPLDARQTLSTKEGVLLGFLVTLPPLPGREALVYAAFHPHPHLLEYLEGYPS